MIRKIAAQDALGVWEIITRSLGYTCEQDVVSRRITQLAGDEHYLSLVCVDDATGAVRGFLHALRYDTLHSEGGWDVISLAVLPEEQGSGVGKALLAAFEQQVQQNGGRYVRLNSRVQREDAHGFYEHLGYTCDKLQKRFIKRLG